jgi:hypothetical protein
MKSPKKQWQVKTHVTTSFSSSLAAYTYAQAVGGDLFTFKGGKWQKIL